MLFFGVPAVFFAIWAVGHFAARSLTLGRGCGRSWAAGSRCHRRQHRSWGRSASAMFSKARRRMGDHGPDGMETAELGKTWKNCGGVF